MMKLLNFEDTSDKILEIERLRFAKEKALNPKTENPCDLADKWNLEAYHQLINLAKKANVQTKKIILKALAEFNDTHKSNQYFYAHVGYSAFGMSHVFDWCIQALYQHHQHQLKMFAKLGA